MRFKLENASSLASLVKDVENFCHNKTAAEVAEKIQNLKATLFSRGFNFGDICPLLLTDNGGEFSRISAFENNCSGTPESHMFFCEPGSPHEKPHIEKNIHFSVILFHQEPHSITLLRNMLI